jgi:hypothetical protein
MTSRRAGCLARKPRPEASRASNQDRHRDGGRRASRQRRVRRSRIGGRRTGMLGAPSRTGAAHVVELRPVRIEQGFEEVVKERADLGGNPLRLTPSGAPANSGYCPDHQARSAVTGSFTHSLVIARSLEVQRPSGSVGLNLRKTRPSARHSLQRHIGRWPHSGCDPRHSLLHF